MRKPSSQGHQSPRLQLQPNIALSDFFFSVRLCFCVYICAYACIYVYVAHAYVVLVYICVHAQYAHMLISYLLAQPILLGNEHSTPLPVPTAWGFSFYFF